MEGVRIKAKIGIKKHEKRKKKKEHREKFIHFEFFIHGYFAGKRLVVSRRGNDRNKLTKKKESENRKEKNELGYSILNLFSLSVLFLFLFTLICDISFDV